MDGIEILNVIEYYDFKIYWLIPIVFLAITICLLSFGEDKTIPFVMTIVTILSIGCCFSWMRKEPKLIYYDVLIDEDVKLEEFLNKYEIVDRNGKIYRIKEIDNGRSNDN